MISSLVEPCPSPMLQLLLCGVIVEAGGSVQSNLPCPYFQWSPLGLYLSGPQGYLLDMWPTSKITHPLAGSTDSATVPEVHFLLKGLVIELGRALHWNTAGDVPVVLSIEFLQERTVTLTHWSWLYIIRELYLRLSPGPASWDPDLIGLHVKVSQGNFISSWQ